MFGAMNCSASQINLPAVLVANGLGIFLLLAVLYSRRKRMRSRACDERFFHWMCLLCLALCLLEICGFLLDGRLFPGARQAALICNTVILLLALSLAYLWVRYVDCKLGLNVGHGAATYLAAIPALLTGFVTLTNLFFPLFFGMNSSNHYYRTPIFFLPWIVIYGYMAWGALQSYRYQRTSNNRLLIPLLMFLVPVFLGSLIQMFCYGLSLIWVSSALGLTFLYINLQSEQAYQDPLTGLYNRNYLLHYMDHIARQVKKGRHITGIMLDINEFKQINDTLGHSEGDAVLRAVGSLLLRSAKNNIVVRYGGDEFVILLETSHPEQVQTVLNNIKQALDSYNATRGSLPPLSFSMGTAEFEEQDIYRFFQNMDSRMYDEKRTFYMHREIHETASNDTRPGGTGV